MTHRRRSLAPGLPSRRSAALTHALAAAVTGAAAAPALAATALATTTVATDPAAEATIARGVVFHDVNADGDRDPGEPGVSAVRVSNGVDVVLTDERGRWELPVEGDAVIHVVKPAGWQVPLNEHHIPRFSYVHRPVGSPDGLAYPGFEPTGPLPDSIDFPLRPHEEPDRFDVVVFGDPQPYTMQDVAWFARDVMAEIAGTDAAFGVSLGDIVGDDLDLFEPLNQAQAMPGIPWYNVYGNHDMNFLSATDEHAAETFIRVYGAADYAFQWGRAHFLVLDNVIWKGPRKRDDGSLDIGNYHGELGDDQLAFVRSYLATVPPDELIVVMTHIPLLSTAAQHSTANRRELLEALSSHPRTLSLSGHTHTQRKILFGPEDGYAPGEHLHANLATASGSWYRGAIDEDGIPETSMRCGAPNGWNVLEVDGADFALRFVPARRPATYQMRIWIDADEMTTAEAAGREVAVNVFAGSERSTVRMRLRPTGGEPTGWMPLRHEVRPDPFMAARKALEASDTPPTGRPLPNLADSFHMWFGELPADLAPGHHVIEVETTDMFGRTHRAMRSLWLRS